MPDYDQLDRDALIRLLQRRDAERQPGPVGERNELDVERARGQDGAFWLARMRG